MYRSGVIILNSDATMSNNTVTANIIGLLVEGQGASAVLNSGTFSGSEFVAARIVGGGCLAIGLDDLDEVQITNQGYGSNKLPVVQKALAFGKF